jgi:hypothetical protein
MALKEMQYHIRKQMTRGRPLDSDQDLIPLADRRHGIEAH